MVTTTQNFIDHKIGSRVSREFKRVATSKTDLVIMQSGRERGNGAWKYPKMRFSTSFALLTRAAQEEVMSAYYACRGRLYLFRFRDYGDYMATDSGFDTSAAIGTTNPVQLTKRYTFGPIFADRLTQAVSTCVVKDHTGTVVDGTFDTALGLFTPTSAWGSGVYTWSGTFDLWVRFTDDEIDVTMMNLEMATSDIDFTESIAVVTITGS